MRRSPRDTRSGSAPSSRRPHQFATTVEGEPYDRLVHADLKPGHVLVGPSGDVKVLDFGIAKALARTTQVTTNNWGTSAYASPERLEHGHVNEHVDFWSLGVILYEMLAGHRPYPALNRNRSQLEHAIRPTRRAIRCRCPARRRLPLSSASCSRIKWSGVIQRRPRSGRSRALSRRRDATCGQRGTSRRRRCQSDAPPGRRPAASAAGGGGRAADRSAAGRCPRPRRAGCGACPAAGAAAPGWPRTSCAPEPGRSSSHARRDRHLGRRSPGLGGAIPALASGIEGRTIAETRADYDGIRAHTMLGTGLRARVNRPLRSRLVALADTVIADYRREEPTMARAEWKQAQQALRWAAELAAR